MEREFVSYEQAVALKELGFTEKCFAFTPGIITPPLKQQVFRWFREKYNYIPHIYKYQDLNKYDFDLYGGLLDLYDEYSLGDDVFDTYEEAEDACIDKLIELAKQQADGK